MPYDFKKATSELTAGISHLELAKALAVSIPSVRQARLDPSAKAYRSAPGEWQTVLADLAEKEANRLLKLAKTLRKTPAKGF